MLIDSSVIIAIFLKEPGYEVPLKKLSSEEGAGVGAPTLAECGIVLTARLGKDPRALLVRFIQEFGIVEIPFGEDHWREAVGAYNRFGKGRHPASLNFGDCMAYAVAKLSGQPLLCMGDDFSKTDLAVI